MDLITAHRLAHFIERVHARSRVDLLNQRVGRGAKFSADYEFDPLAATCLGDLIYRVANNRPALNRQEAGNPNR